LLFRTTAADFDLGLAAFALNSVTPISTLFVIIIIMIIILTSVQNGVCPDQCT